MTASTASIPPSGDAEARRYSGVAMALHGLIALGIVAQIGLGWYMGTLEGKAGKAVEAIHIPLGLTVLMLTVLRLAWRLIHRPPAMPAELKSWEKHMAVSPAGGVKRPCRYFIGSCALSFKVSTVMKAITAPMVT